MCGSFVATILAEVGEKLKSIETRDQSQG